MQYEAKTPAEFIENLEADWRKQKLLEVRDLIMRNAGDIGEGIEYKMLCNADIIQNISVSDFNKLWWICIVK